jgi:hypothetical protein
MELATRSEFQPNAYRGYWFRIPTSPSDLPSALWFFAPGSAGAVCTIPVTPLVGFRVPPESCPVGPSQAPRQAAATLAPLVSFPSLQHTGVADPHTRACLTRFVPSSGFGYPPDGFRPATPGRPCFVPAAPVGFFRPFGAFSSRKVPEAITPPGAPACRSTGRCT